MEEPLKEWLKDADAPKFDFDRPYLELKEESRRNTAHTPRQQGPWLVCTSCAYAHTLAWLGMDKLFEGYDEKGELILKKR